MKKLKKIISLVLIALITPFIFSCRKVYYSVISFETNGGNKIESIEGEIGTSLNLPTPVYEDYEFLGWYKDPGFTKSFQANIFPKESLKLYAKWDIKDYSFTLNLLNGEDDLNITLKKNELEKLPTPTLEGFKFDSWYYDLEFKNKFNPLNLDNEDVHLYAKYNRVDDRYAFVSPNASAEGNGQIDNGVSLEKGISNFDYLYILPGEYKLENNDLLLSSKVLKGIGNVSIDFKKTANGISLLSNNILSNLDLINANKNAIEIKGNNNNLTNIKIENSLNNGLVIYSKDAYGNKVEALESINNKENGILLDSVGSDNIFASIASVGNGDNGFKVIMNDKDYPVNIINNALFYDNGKNNSLTSLENGNGLYLGDLERNCFLRLNNIVSSNNRNFGIYSKAIGGITIENSTLYNNKLNLCLENGKFNKLISSISYNSKYKNEDLFNGYLINSSIMSNKGLIDFKQYQRRNDENGILNLTFKIDDTTINPTYKFEAGKLILEKYLITNLNYGAKLDGNDYLNLSNKTSSERIIWGLDLTNLINNSYLPKIAGKLEFTNNVSNLNENEQRLFGNNLVKVKATQNQKISVKIDGKEKEIDFNLPINNYNLGYELINCRVDYLLNEEFVKPEIILFSKDDYKKIEADQYTLEFKYYLIKENEEKLVEQIDTKIKGRYRIEFTINYDKDIVKGSYVIQVLEEPEILVDENFIFIDPIGNLQVELPLEVGEIYTITVNKGSKAPNNLQVIAGKNYEDVIIINHKKHVFNNNKFEISGYNYNENYDNYLVVKVQTRLSDSIKINLLDKTIVKDAQELKRAVDEQRPFISIENDINLGELKTCLPKYKGFIDGNNNELYGYKIVDRNNLESLGLFYGLDNAHISNIKINDFYIDSNANMAGLLAGFSNNLVLENIKVSYSTVNSKHYSGALIGKAYGNISINKIEIIGNKNHSIYGEFSGGLVGYVKASSINIEDCNLMLRIAGNYSGGVFGKLDGNLIRTELNISRVFVRSSITGFRASAGLISYTDILEMDNRMNIEGVIIDSIFTENNGYSIINESNLLYAKKPFKNTYNLAVNLRVDNSSKFIQFSELNFEFLSSIFDLESIWNFDENKHEIRLK